MKIIASPFFTQLVNNNSGCSVTFAQIASYEGTMSNHWIGERLKKIGKKKKDLADKLFNGRNATITQIMNGARAIRADEVSPLADFLQMTEAELLQALRKKSPQLSPPLSVVQIPLIGSVQAGLWQEPSMETDRYMPMAEISPLSKKAFAVRVMGDSMDQFYEEGRLVVCLSIWDYPREIVSGDHVICHRTGDGDTVEATIKEVRKDQNGGIWLWPRSNNPEYQDPWLCPMPDGGEPQAGAGDISIAAVVVGDYMIKAI